MNEIAAIVFVCTLAATQLKDGSSVPLSKQAAAQHGDDSILKEQIHDKTAYIAAITDQQHLNFIEFLKSEMAPQPPQTEAEVAKLLEEHMMNVTKTIFPDLESLIEMTDNREDSAREVNRHFAEDHVNAILRVIFKDDIPRPKYYNSLRKKIAEFAQGQIRAIFNIHKEHI